METTTLRQKIPPKRILLVEDDLMVAQTVRMALAVDGHSVEIAQDGEQGLTMFKPGEHDLVITDFKLAKMDGLELAQVIRERIPGQPIILMTAHAEGLTNGMGKVSNIDVLLKKPFSMAELQGALIKIFLAH